MKTVEQDQIDKDFGARMRTCALRLWRSLTSAGICETPEQYAAVDAVAFPLDGDPYFIEVQARRCKILDYPNLMFDASQYQKILEYAKDLGFPTVLLAVWEDGLAHVRFPYPLGDPVIQTCFTNGRSKVLLDLDCFNWVAPDAFAKFFPSHLFL